MAAASKKGGGKKSSVPPENVYGRCESNETRASSYDTQIASDLALITAQPKMSTLLRAVGPGSAQSPFDDQCYRVPMTNSNVDRCGGNALWASIASGPVAGNMKNLQRFVQFAFKEPAPVFPETIVIGSNFSNSPSPLTNDDRGKLWRLSPEEPLHAWIVNTAQCIKDGHDPDELKWINMIKNAPLEFRTVEDQGAVFWKQVQERENLGHRFTLMYRSTSGRVLEIVHFADSESKRLNREISRPEITKSWEVNFNGSVQSDKVNFSMVDSAMKVYIGIFRTSVNLELVTDTEDIDKFPKGSPWTVYKLVEVVRKATLANVVDTSRVTAMLSGVNFRVLHNWLEPGEASVRGLSGRGLPGNRGLLDLVLLQSDLAKHLLNETMESLPLPSSDKIELRNKMDTVIHYETYCKQGSIAWLGNLDPPSQRFQTLVESICYTRECDGYLKAGLKAQKSIAEMLQEPPFREKLQAISESEKPSNDQTTPMKDGTAADSAAVEDVHRLKIAMQINLGSDNADDDVQEKFKNMTNENKDAVHEVELSALRLVDIGCQLLTEKETPLEMANDMRNTERAKIVADPPTSYCMFVYVPRVAGEASTQPRNRPPPLRIVPTNPGGNHLRRQLQACMMMRAVPEENYEIADGDVYVVSDSGKHGNHQTICNQFVDKHGKPLEKEVRCLTLFSSESSVDSAADSLIRGVMTLRQTEHWLFVTRSTMQCLRKPLVRFPKCTTASQCIGPVDLPNPDDKTTSWHLTFGAKKKIYGHALIRPGGPNPGNAGLVGGEEKEKKEKTHREND